jgi:outer membrane protein assembly factor BamB
MSRPRALLTIFLLSLAVPAAGSDAARQLAERADRPPDPPSESPAPIVAAVPGVALFTSTGPDNAAAVRSVPDVTADGKDEVLLGIDVSGQPNLFLLDGASLGTADVVWSYQTAHGASGGTFYGDQCLVVASDADGNGAADILAGTSRGGRTAYAIDSEAGAIHWFYDTYDFPPASGWVYSLAELSDVTEDGVPEVAFGAGSDSNSVYAVDGASGDPPTLLWRYQASDAISSVRAPGDLDGDGALDLVAAVGDADGHVVLALDGDPPTAAGATLWSYPTGSPTVYVVGALPDVTRDGVAEALAGLWTIDGSAVRCLNGATGALVWASTEITDYVMLVEPIADVDDDGEADVVVSSWENAAQVLSGADGTRVWKRTVGTENGGDVWTARPIGDLNGDGVADVVAGSFDGHVYALSGKNGWPFWAYDTGNRVFSVHALGDLDGDAIPEVGAATQDTTSSTVLYVLLGDAGVDLPLFADDFENAAPVGWSDVVPPLP